MKNVFSAFFLSLAVAHCGLAPAAWAQQPERTRVEATADKQQALVGLLNEALLASRTAEIYADIRHVVRELYLPYFKELSRNDRASADPEFAARIAVIIPVLDYGLKAADELDPVLEANRGAMLGDVASLLAKYMTREEIRLAGEMLSTPAARKGFNVLYAVSRLITGYNREDMRASNELTEWMRGLNFDLKNNPFADSEAPPPPPERVAKAEAVVADFMRVSRLDDMVADIIRFTNDVLLQVETLDEDEREQIRVGVQRLEFFYNLGKSMSVAAAPVALASVLDDEQLAQFHLMVSSPLTANSFGLVYDIVRQATSFTRSDISQFRQLAAEAEASKSSMDPEARRLMEADWDALHEKWHDRLWASLSPETRTGLERSIDDFDALFDEENRKFRRGMKMPPSEERQL
jgi:hypothetical protein